MQFDISVIVLKVHHRKVETIFGYIQKIFSWKKNNNEFLFFYR